MCACVTVVAAGLVGGSTVHQAIGHAKRVFTAEAAVSLDSSLNSNACFCCYGSSASDFKCSNTDVDEKGGKLEAERVRVGVGVRLKK